MSSIQHDQIPTKDPLRSSSLEEREYHTPIEHLPDELFYEIFDYLDGCDIYRSFSELNRRFQRILSSSPIRLKISLLPFLDVDIEQHCTKIISQQRHQIHSLRLTYTSNIHRFLTTTSLDASFSSLESLTLIGIRPDDLYQRLQSLKSLPRLSSLVLCLGSNFKNFSDIYQFIFHLPVLKSLTLSSEAYEPSILLSMATDQQYSSIEYLIVHHSCSLNDLAVLISYTPQLKQFTCRELIRSNEKVSEEPVVYLASLTSMCLSECYVVFERLERFLKGVTSKLQVMHVTTYWDERYLDADRWEQLFIEHMPCLREFSLQHHDFLDDDFQVTEYHQSIDRFTSTFWSARRWVFGLAIDVNDNSWSEIIYSIHPSKKPWFELTDIDHLEGITLTLTTPFRRESKELFTDTIITLFASFRIARLDILYPEIATEVLSDLLDHLPHLDSLRICSLSWPNASAPTIPKTNQITKFNIQHLTDRLPVQFLIDLCPNVQYLEIGCSTDIDPKFLTRSILINKPSSLRVLCLCLSIKAETMKEELQEMINLEKLCFNYKIYQSDNRIYLQWT